MTTSTYLNFCSNSSFRSRLAPKERSGLGAIADKTTEFKEIKISLDFFVSFLGNAKKNERKQ